MEAVSPTLALLRSCAQEGLSPGLIAGGAESTQSRYLCARSRHSKPVATTHSNPTQPACPRCLPYSHQEIDRFALAAESNTLSLVMSKALHSRPTASEAACTWPIRGFSSYFQPDDAIPVILPNFSICWQINGHILEQLMREK